jgi:hypothetical protein
MANIRTLTPEGSATAVQSRRMALVEAATNVVVGYGLAVLVQVVVFPVFGILLSVGENLAIGAVFTVVSMARSYLLRRLFERIRIGGLQREAAALWRAAATIGLWVGQLPMR